mmetsp:Transcript_4822/g.7507  ORF Transcript_4822/g.7507 Transcript_4822/m.7507 type:complete len:195 (-) Transcript_4822:551-1135(-)
MRVNAHCFLVPLPRSLRAKRTYSPRTPFHLSSAMYGYNPDNGGMDETSRFLYEPPSKAFLAAMAIELGFASDSFQEMPVPSDLAALSSSVSVPVATGHRPREARHTYCVGVSYLGYDFSGWAWQPNKRTAEDIIQQSILSYFSKPPVLSVAGRTDSGVSAFAQVFGFSSWKPINHDDIRQAINLASPNSLRVYM